MSGRGDPAPDDGKGTHVVSERARSWSYMNRGLQIMSLKQEAHPEATLGLKDAFWVSPHFLQGSTNRLISMPTPPLLKENCISRL